MVKLVHEVWEDPANGSISMFLRGHKEKQCLGADARLLHVFEAESCFEAFRTHHRLMGWGEWKAPALMDDIVYDGSEA